MNTQLAQEKTHYKLLTNPNYIGSYALMVDATTSKDLPVTIIGATKELVQNGDKKEEALVLKLKGQKPMILNSTNQKAISKAIGSPFIEDWIGKTIVLYTIKIKAFGEFVYALRVRDKLAEIKIPELSPESPKWESAITALKAGNTTIEKIKKAMSLTPENEILLNDAITEQV